MEHIEHTSAVKRPQAFPLLVFLVVLLVGDAGVAEHNTKVFIQQSQIMQAAPHMGQPRYTVMQHPVSCMSCLVKMSSEDPRPPPS